MFENREGSRMARFFFHVKNDSTFKEEEEGENYPNLETARAHAAKIASELAPTEAALQGPGLWRKIIRDRVRPLAAFSHLVER